jgi:hypothetical protein
MSAVVKMKKKREKKRSSSSRVCGKVGNMRLLSTFPQTNQGEKEKKERGIRIQSNHKSPIRIAKK